MNTTPRQIEVSADDAALLSEAYDYSQFYGLVLPVSVKAALYRVLDAIQAANNNSN